MEEKGELMPVLEQIERDKGIKKEEILAMIENAVVSAYKKHSGKNFNLEATIDPNTAEIRAYMVKEVVENPQNDSLEISLKEAKKLSQEAELNSLLKIPIDTVDFSRIAAQTAKQVIIQKIRETERDALFEEFKKKEGDLVNGSVHRFVDKNIIVDLGKVEAILPVREQVRKETYNISDRLKVVILKVEKGPRGPQILVSRTAPELVKRLFEQEVPEVYEKTVEIVAVVRDPGMRSKVAVRSHNPKVDPVGACVGVKGSRVKPIIDELFGERIDLISYSPDYIKYMASSLSPAKALSVTVKDEKNKQAEVLVADDMLSLAIGKSGQNVRLAARLTGWHIDIKSENQKKDIQKEKTAASTEEISSLDGVGTKTAEILVKAGRGSIERLAQATVEELTAFQGIGAKTAERVIASAQKHIAGDSKPRPDETAGKTAEKPKKKKKTSVKKKKTALKDSSPEDTDKKNKSEAEAADGKGVSADDGEKDGEKDKEKGGKEA
ncbi:MAG: transcription termination factor NusA [bacterium]